MKRGNYLFILFICAILVLSCKSGPDKKDAKDAPTAINDDVLFGYMLGGMYPAYGWGGVATTEENFIDPVLKADKGTGEYLQQMEKGYREGYRFPFKETERSGILSTLSSMWDISNREALLKKLDELTDAKHGTAWDIARYANLVNMGKPAGFITETEADDLVKKLVPIAKAKYSDWETYMKAFNEGRNAWDPEASDGSEFEKVCKDLLTSSKSIYPYLALK